MSNKARDTLENMLREEIINRPDRYKVQFSPLHEWLAVHDLEMVSGHEFTVTAVDSDGVAVKAPVFVGLGNGCACGEEDEYLDRQNRGEGFIPNAQFKELMESRSEEAIGVLLKDHLAQTLATAAQLREMIRTAESDGYETGVVYQLLQDEPGLPSYFYCTKVGKCEKTGLQQLGGFSVGPEGQTPMLVLSIYIDKKVD